MRQGHFVIADKRTGEIVSRGQGIYWCDRSAQRGLYYWIKKAERENFKVIEITKENVLGVIANATDHN